MKFSAIIALAAAVAAPVLASSPKNYVVTFPSGTKPEVVDSAIRAVESAGGKMTHRYNLIDGFTVTAPEDVMTGFSTQEIGGQKPNVEEDEVVTILSS